MLIEAADHLPNWANPETCEGCVSVFFICMIIIFMLNVCLVAHPEWKTAFN